MDPTGEFSLIVSVRLDTDGASFTFCTLMTTSENLHKWPTCTAWHDRLSRTQLSLHDDATWKTMWLHHHDDTFTHPINTGRVGTPLSDTLTVRV
jgi:hypothetical protein